MRHVLTVLLVGLITYLAWQDRPARVAGRAAADELDGWLEELLAV